MNGIGRYAVSLVCLGLFVEEIDKVFFYLSKLRGKNFTIQAKNS